MGWFNEQPGGLDRFYAGLLQTFGRMDQPYYGLVTGSSRVSKETGGKICAFSEPSAGIIKRWRCIHRAYCSQHAISPEFTVTHFALYAFPLLFHLYRQPHIVHFQGPWADETAVEGDRGLANKFKYMLEKRVYRSANRLITLSSSFKQLLHQRYDVPLDRIHVVPGGIDTQAYECTLSPDDARRKLDWPSDRRIVLCVRRLAARMGHEPLIDAASMLRDRHPNLLIMIAGKGRLESVLRDKIDQAGLDNHVRLLGFVSDEDLPLAYRASDLSAVPTQSLEGFGLITLESLAAGTPCLVTPVGGLPEAVGELDSQLILDGTDAESIAAGLDRALSEPQRLPNETACVEYVRQNFDWSVIAPRVLNVYAEAIEAFHTK